MSFIDAEPVVAAAAARCEFRLTYAQTSPRRFSPSLLSGPDIPDAWNSDRTSSGIWDDGGDADLERRLESGDEQDWIDHFASMAINEAVHEALEWFQVDGRSWLDPHGEHQEIIASLVDKLAADLAKLRRGRSS